MLSLFKSILFRRILVAAVILVAAGSVEAQASSPTCESAKTDFEIGVCAYVYGYPLLMVDATKNIATNVHNATETLGRAPIDQFSNNSLPDASYTDIVLPSVSTPYSNAFLDLSAEPIVLTLPDLGDRFFLMQILNAWTEVGPDWKGKLPKGIDQVIELATNTAWIAGRTLTTGTKEDLKKVAAIQKEYKLTPLSKFGRPYTPPSYVPINPRIDMSRTPRDTVAGLTAGQYYGRLALLMGPNPPLPADAPLVAKFARIGLVPGKPFDIAGLPRRTRLALTAAAAAAKRIIVNAAQRIDLTPTNWSMSLDLGAYGTRYLERAAVAYSGIGANLYLDAVYAGVIEDAGGKALQGSNRYRLRFAPGQFPPSNPKAFWSVTLYNRPSETLFDNPLGRAR
jgi:hypothetical protein